jgi:hypothetical protein
MNGTQLLTLAIQDDFRPYVEEFDGKDLKAEIKPFKGKRSLSANAYAFLLIDKLAEKLRIPPKEVYRNAIRNIGGVSDVVCCQNFAVEDFCRKWENKGLGWQTEILDSKIDGCTNIICYYGSSEYDTEQMSRLIDNIVQDCKSVGIETMTPAELERLCDAWQ